MLVQVGAPTGYIALIDKIHATAKTGIVNPLVVGQIQFVRASRLLNPSLQSCPTREPGLVRDGELRIAQPQASIKDFSIAGTSKTGMKFPDVPGRYSVACGIISEQVSGLVFQMIDGRWGKGSYRHDELFTPESALIGKKLVRR
jgi:hypothetical protein